MTTTPKPTTGEKPMRTIARRITDDLRRCAGEAMFKSKAPTEVRDKYIDELRAFAARFEEMEASVWGEQ